jgi:hypothetical protein
MKAFIQEFESSSRREIIQHEIDNFDGILTMFVSIAKLIISNNTSKSLNQSIKNLRNAVDTERELNANVRGQLDREIGQRLSVEQTNLKAVEWCEHWRIKASEAAQALQEVSEAKDLAHDAALFWKARCVCATAALKQITNGSSDFDFSAFGSATAVPLPSDVEKKKSHHHHLHHKHHHEKRSASAANVKKSSTVPGLYTHLEENYASDYLHHNMKQSSTTLSHPSHRPTRF